MSRGLRILCIVQGEGRGHLSQALALREMLEEAGHAVVGVLLGGSDLRAVPDYFAQGMGLEPERFASPVTVPGRDLRGVSIRATLLHNAARVRDYRRAPGVIRERVRAIAPDLIVNFYEALGGLAVRGSGYPAVAIGHQYLLGHPGAPRPPFRPLELLPFRLLNRLSAPRGTLRLALSLRDLPDRPAEGLLVVPPLLRRRVREARPEAGRHLLVYVVNNGYGEEVVRWQRDHPEVLIHAFWDRRGAPEEEVVQPNLILHRLSDVRFLEAMRTCRAFVGTAGFESVAEALWLGKPVLVVPTAHQVEQAWNAREAVVAGAGVASESFDLSLVLDWIERNEPRTEPYRAWVRAGYPRFLSLLESAAAGGRGSRTGTGG